MDVDSMKNTMSANATANSKALSKKIPPSMIDTPLSAMNEAGGCRGTVVAKGYIFFQDGSKRTLFTFPTPKRARKCGRRSNRQTTMNAAILLPMMEAKQQASIGRQERREKRVVDDDVHIGINLGACDQQTEKLSVKQAMYSKLDHTCWTSPEARLLFNPMPDETLTQCLAR
jgi:hypothetical protein